MPANTVIVNTELGLRNALLAASSTPISKIVIDIDTLVLVVNQPLILPKVLNSPGKQLIIEGNGCTIQYQLASPPGVNHIMKVDDPVSTAEISSMVDNRFIIRNIKFNGRNANLTCLELSATKMSIVEGCEFFQAPYGLRLLYATHTRVISCRASNISYIAFDINVLTAGTQAPLPSATNIWGSHFTRLENIYVETETNANAGINIYASGACVLSQIYCGPKPPKHHIVFDSALYSRADNIMMDNIYIAGGVMPNAAAAGSPVHSAIKLNMFGGYAKISGVTCDIGLILVEADNTAPQSLTMARVYLSHVTRIITPNPPQVNSYTTFKTGNSCSDPNVIWEMFDVDQGDTIWQTTRWYGGIVPIHRYSEYYQSPRNNKEIVTNSMKVNNNIISSCPICP